MDEIDNSKLKKRVSVKRCGFFLMDDDDDVMMIMM